MKYSFLTGMLLIALISALISGCATTDDLRKTERYLNEKLTTLQEENIRLKKELDASKESVKPLRKAQADAGADLIDIRDSLQSLKGSVEEFKREVASLKTERKEREARLNEILFRIAFLENFLGIGKKGEGEENARKDLKQNASAPAGKPNGKPNDRMDREPAYNAAYKDFKEGRYEEARRGFQKFLEMYSKGDYADNAQFWLGECYYLEGKHEKAILEYEKVVKNFPNSDKVPNALFKQSLSFLKLGDKASARLILRQVIKDYPNTNQARAARAKLAEIKR